MQLCSGRSLLILFLSFIGAFACSGTDTSTPSHEAGGSASVGGATAGGSSPGAGGSVGGATSAANTGGLAATGGVTSNGGTPSTGGVAPTGGRMATGGVPATGGRAATGGSQANGGTSSYAPCAAGTTCAVLPLGDSITEGCCVGSYGGYRTELFHQALTNSKKITFVGSLTNGPTTVDSQTFPQHHEGHGGYTIDSGTGHNGISGQITDSAISNNHPGIVLLMIGTNDINGNIDTANAPTRLGNLMDEIIKDAPNALLVVASIIPSKTDGTNNNFRTYNAAIPGLVDTRAKAGKHIIFVDNYAAISQNTDYKTALMNDNLHPNAAGYVVLGQSFYNAISSVLP